MSEEEKGIIEYFDYQIELAKKEIENYKEDEFKGIGILEDIAKMRYCNFIKIKNLIDRLQKENEKLKGIKEYINSPEFLDWHLKFKLIDELEYRKDRINKLLVGDIE